MTSSSNGNPSPDLEGPVIEPRLPRELERIIFEMAAHIDRHKELRVLRLVARRVRSWLEPLLYEIVILQGALLYQDTKSFFYHHRPSYPSGSDRRHVKYLLVYGISKTPAEPDWKELLPDCHNLQDLALWCHLISDTLAILTSIIHSPLRTAPPLFRLSISLGALFPDGKVDFHHDVLKHLVYLDVLDHPSQLGGWVEGNNYASLKNLRCLAFAYFTSEFSFPTEVLTKCLEECEALELMILPSRHDVKHNVSRLPKTRTVRVNGTVKKVPEDRVVVYSGPTGNGEGWGEDWYRGAERGVDFWSHSMEVVRRRRCRRELKSEIWGPMSDDDSDIDLGECLNVMEL
ncbi:hypothetical protein AX16_004170 [Volvariella volvacea WC 439]|nr:hypothetical protein AX16_004170 [Volvariella volvacea WC 439]